MKGNKKMPKCKSIVAVGFHWLKPAGLLHLPGDKVARVKKCDHCEYRAYQVGNSELKQLEPMTAEQPKRRQSDGLPRLW